MCQLDGELITCASCCREEVSGVVEECFCAIEYGQTSSMILIDCDEVDED